MLARWLMRLYAAIAALGSIAALAYVLISPPPGMQMSREGVPYFTPPVVDPLGGEPIPLERLVRHYRGEPQ